MATRRARTVRRQAERDGAKLARAQDEAFVAAEGGHPGWPVVVGSATQVEARASARPCPRCGGVARLTEHRAEVYRERRVRAVDLWCGRCAHRFTVYLAVGGPLLS